LHFCSKVIIELFFSHLQEAIPAVDIEKTNGLVYSGYGQAHVPVSSSNGRTLEPLQSAHFKAGAFP
jgi:hypothetical protein